MTDRSNGMLGKLGTERLVLLISILGSFVAFLDGSVVNVALPSITKDLGGGLAGQQWIIDGYLITLGALILLAGSLSDLYGRTKVFTAGLIGFGICSVLCAIAPDAPFLIVARLLQGISGALLVPSSLALILSTFSGKAQGKAIGTWTAYTGISFIIGPLLGGFLVDASSWRLIFAINVIPILFTLMLLVKLPKVQRTKNSTRVDFLGAILCTLGLGGPVYALIEQPVYGWTPFIIIALVGGVAAFIGFLRHESRAPKPMLPLSLFARRNFAYGNIATAAIYGGLSIATFLIVIYLQQIGGYSALRAGLALLPVTIVMFFLSPRFGALSSKFGPRLFMTVGPLIAATGFLLMLRVGSTIGYWTDLLPGVLIFALGLSTTVAPLTAAILGDIDPKLAGIGSAVNNAVSRIAGLITIAVIGLVTGAQLDEAGFHRALIVTACLMITGGLISFAGIRNPNLK